MDEPLKWNCLASDTVVLVLSAKTVAIHLSKYFCFQVIDQWNRRLQTYTFFIFWRVFLNAQQAFSTFTQWYGNNTVYIWEAKLLFHYIRHETAYLYFSSQTLINMVSQSNIFAARNNNFIGWLMDILQSFSVEWILSVIQFFIAVKNLFLFNPFLVWQQLIDNMYDICFFPYQQRWWRPKLHRFLC